MRRVLIFTLLLLLGGIFYFTRKTSPPQSFPATEEKPFTIVIPSYNNGEYVERNLRSVYAQKYENYRVVYIDDGSTDDTLEKALHLIQTLGQEGRTTLQINKRNQGTLANLYQAVHLCRDHEIILQLDGDDFFAHERVLERLNQAYANPNTWLTYGSSLTYPGYSSDPLWSSPKSGKKIRKRGIPPPPYSFYAALFKQIPLGDLFYRGHFYPMGVDMAILSPMFEMGKGHIEHISDCLHLSNQQNPLSCRQIHPAFQRECLDAIASSASSPSLSHLIHSHKGSQEKADLLILSEDNPIQLQALLESINHFVNGLGNLTIVYKASNSDYQIGYQQLRKDFPNATLIQQGAPPFDLSTLYRKILAKGGPAQSPFIALLRDTMVITNPIDLAEGTELLKKTKGFALFYSYHPNLIYSADLERYQPLPPFTLLNFGEESQIYAWQITKGEDDWSAPTKDRFALYKREVLKGVVENTSSKEEQVALFYPTPKCIELKETTEKKVLLDLFQKGERIDITPLFHAICPAQRIEANTICQK